MEDEVETTKRYRLRWAVDLETEMARGNFRDRLALLPAPEQQQVLQFLQPADQHRALVSRLMQRCCVASALGVEWRSVALAVTKGRKPFTTNAKPLAAPNFNFNVSHEGRYVVLASEPLHLVGVDVAAPRSARPGPATQRPLGQYLQSFRGQMADCEWVLLQSLEADEAGREAAFQRLWSLKEAFIKARGDGLGFTPLSRAAFTFPSGDPWAASAALMLDGTPRSSWRFDLEPLPGGHCVSVALGPPADAVDALGVFRASLLQPSVPDPDAQVAPAARFIFVSLEQLLGVAQIVD